MWYLSPKYGRQLLHTAFIHEWVNWICWACVTDAPSAPSAPSSPGAIRARSRVRARARRHAHHPAEQGGAKRRRCASALALAPHFLTPIPDTLHMPDRQAPAAHTPKLDAASLNAFLARAFPHSQAQERAHVDAVASGEVLMSREPTLNNLRPGGIVSGPTLMALADATAYMAVLAHIGEVAMAVTSALNYQFLQACPRETVRARGTLLKLSSRQAVVDVRIFVDSLPGEVGQAIVTYAIPRPAQKN
jgi:acyl-coenzyme A thioesterase PaaI-like protein